MAPGRFLVVTVVAAILAGCMERDVPVPAADEDAAPEILVDADRPDTEFTEVVTGPAVGPDVNATTAAAPRLVPGEWWRIQFSSEFYQGVSEVVRVVADVSDDSDECDSSSPQAAACGGYVFGMPHEGWFKEAISYHAPAFGDVGLDLSYATHNEIFTPLKFPLVEGDSWETTFATSPVVATVESVDEHVAVVRLDSPSEDGGVDPMMAVYGLAGFAAPESMRLTYDARQHEVVKFESSIGLWEVVEHGYGFEGWVTVPRGEHTPIDYGAGPGSPPTPSEIEVAGGFNRLTLMQLAIGVTPGVYRVLNVAPDGTEFMTESVGAPGFVIQFHEARDPDGVWTVQDTVAGVGATYSMGIAYHQYDIRLPDGLRRTDHSHEVIR